MHQLQVIVPHGLICEAVHANGHLGRFLHATTQAGAGYDVQTWEVPVNPIGAYHVNYVIKQVMPVPARVR